MKYEQISHGNYSYVNQYPKFKSIKALQNAYPTHLR